MNNTFFISDFIQDIKCPANNIMRVNYVKASSNTPNCDNKALEDRVINLCEGKNSCRIENSITGCPKYLYSFNFNCEPVAANSSLLQPELNPQEEEVVVPDQEPVQTIINENNPFVVEQPSEPNNVGPTLSSVCLVIVLVLLCILLFYRLMKPKTKS